VPPRPGRSPWPTRPGPSWSTGPRASARVRWWWGSAAWPGHRRSARRRAAAADPRGGPGARRRPCRRAPRRAV